MMQDHELILRMMHDPSSVNFAKVVEQLATGSSSFGVYVLDNTDLSQIPRQQIMELGLYNRDARIKDIALRILGQNYRPRSHRYYAAPALLMLQEPVVENIQSWAEFHRTDSPKMMLEFILDGLLERQVSIPVPDDLELPIMDCLLHAYNPRADWDGSTLQKAIQIFQIRANTAAHQRVWRRIFGGKKATVAIKTIDQMLKARVLEHHFRWTVDTWSHGPNAEVTRSKMPHPHSVGAIYPRYLNEYQETLNMLAIMTR